jgi:transposase
VVGMEACSGAHHWARELTQLGHQPQIMAAEFVRPFRKSLAAKNDANDAEAVCTAVVQPNMRWVALKSVEQQALLSLHRVRQGLIEERTASINRLRGVLAEFGVILPQSAAVLQRALPALLADQGRLPALAQRSLQALLEHLRDLDARLAGFDRDIAQHARSSASAQRLGALSGVGPLTASAVVATVGNARDYRNGRQFAAWLGLVPRHYSSGGKRKLGSITRRGDAYLRALLIQGARSTLQAGITPSAGTTRSAQRLGRAVGAARGLSQDAGGDRQQARPHHLGLARPRSDPRPRACVHALIEQRLSCSSQRLRRPRACGNRSDRRGANLANLTVEILDR